MNTLYDILAAEWHPTKNGNLRLENITHSSAKKIWWKCRVDPRHEWQARFFSRTKNGAGCPYCKGKRVLPEDSLAMKHPELLAQWHYEKNSGLDPTVLHTKSGKKVWWRCNKGHEWQAHIHHRVAGGRTKRGTGCPYCSNKKVDENNCLAVTDPQLLKEWHPTKNIISPTEVVRSSIVKIWWKCPVADDHEWEAALYNKVRNGGCPCCIGRKIVLSNCLATTHPDIAAEWHPTKNTLTPFMVTAYSNKRAWWRCSLDPTHEWESLIYGRTIPSQCPFCASSKGEKITKEYLEKNNIKFEREYRITECKHIRPLPFDFAILSQNGQLLGLIEYQGIHHYMPRDFLGGVKRLITTKNNDAIKKKYCEQHNIKLLAIPYTEINKTISLIKDFLLTLAAS